MFYRLTILLIVLACSVSLPGKEKPEPPLAKVGVASLQSAPPENYNWRGQAEQTLAPTVWYPVVSTAEEKPQYIGPPEAPLFYAGKALPNAPLAPSFKPYPLIVLSHGTGGSALQMAWLGTYLAARGNIVVAVNHPGNNAMFGYTPQGFAEIWERARDVSTIIDQVLADGRFGKRIDPERIGVAGFSLGGYTGIAVSGGVTSWENIRRFCAQPEYRRLCSPPEFPDFLEKFEAIAGQDPLAQASIQRSSQSFRDPRVRAAFVIAPGVSRAFTPEGLAKVEVPVQIVVGAADKNTPPKVDAEYYARHIKRAQLTVLPGDVGHYTFLATATDLGRKEFFVFATDPPGVDRDAVHRQVGKMASDFFDKELAPVKPGKKKK